MYVDKSCGEGENITFFIMSLFKLTIQVYQNSKYRNTETDGLKAEFSLFCIESDLTQFVSIWNNGLKIFLLQPKSLVK